ncbi:MAG: peptidylprolyl isomerase [Planctomycetota bacterium]|nr:peptidylprolyl isomerase [Planctomycetota bacterium]
MLAWLRKRMNKLLWIVAIVVAVSFGMTYTMMAVLERMFARHNYVFVFGEKVRDYEIAEERSLLQTERLLSGGTTSIEQKELWEEMAILKEAERLGLRVSTDTIEQWVKRWYTERKLVEYWWDKTQNKTPEEFQRERQKFYSLPPMEQVRIWEELSGQFTEADFKRLLEKFYQSISPALFREVLRRILLKEMVRETVRRDVDIPLEEIHKEFLRRYHKRKLQMVYLRASDFRDLVVVSDDELAKFYEEVKESYKHPERLTFDYVMIPLEEAMKEVAEPSRQELEKQYNRLKWQPEVGNRPLEEVEEYVAKKFKEMRGMEIAEQKAEELLKEIGQKTEEEINKIISEKGLSLKRTVPATDEEFAEKNKDEFGKTPAFASLMYRDVRQKGTEKFRGVFSGALRCEKGVFIWRLAEVIPPRLKELSEVKEEIERRYRVKEAERVAENTARGLVLEARSGTPLKEIALRRNLVLVETDFLSSPQNRGKIAGVPNDSVILNAAFREEGDDILKEVGDVIGPVSVPSGGDKYFYVIRYAERKEPDKEMFSDLFHTVRSEILNKRWSELEKRWKDDLLARANIVDSEGNSIIKQLSEKRPQEPPPLEEE